MKNLIECISGHNEHSLLLLQQNLFFANRYLL